MITINEIRKILNLPTTITDEYLELTVQMYKDRIVHALGGYDKITPALFDNPLFNEAILAGVGCQVSRVYPQYIFAPSKYEVGDTKEEYSDNIFNTDSWCSDYERALADLIAEMTEIKNVQVFRRRGLSSAEGWYS